ncbi:uncharacterized protein LOC144439381 [Glandiceps talaboti]
MSICKNVKISKRDSDDEVYCATASEIVMGDESTPDDRERTKKGEQRKRREMTGDKDATGPLFGAPFKITPRSPDDIGMRIQRTLGSYEAIQPSLSSKYSSHLLGIPKQPQTPVTKAGGPSFPDNAPRAVLPGYAAQNGTGALSAVDSKFPPCGANDVVRNVIVGATDSSGSSVSHHTGKSKSETKSPGSSRKSSKNKSESNPKEGKSKSSSSAKSDNSRGNTANEAKTVSNTDTKSSFEETKKKDKEDKVSISMPTVSPHKTDSKAQHASGNNKTECDHVVSTKSPNNKKDEGFQMPQPVNRPPLFTQLKSPTKEPVVNQVKGSTASIASVTKALFEERPNGLLYNGVIKETESTSTHGKAEKTSSKKTLPKLQIAQQTELSAGEQGEGSQADVENILKEMTQTIDPLLTAIQTPIKGEPHKFQFPALEEKHSPAYQLFTHKKTTNPSAVKPSKMGPSAEMNTATAGDSEDEQEAPEGRHLANKNPLQTVRHTPSRPHSPSSSSSGSSSSESEDESGSESDSETSSSEASPPASPSPAETKPKSWALSNFIHNTPKVKNSSGPSQSNKHPKLGTSSFPSQDTAAWKPSAMLSDLGDTSNGFDNISLNDSPQGFDPGGGGGGGDNHIHKMNRCGMENGISVKVRAAEKRPESKGKSPLKNSASDGVGKMSAKHTTKKKSGGKKHSAGKPNTTNIVTVAKSELPKEKSKDSKHKPSKQTSKSEVKHDGKPKSSKQLTPKHEKSSTPKSSEKKGKKPPNTINSKKIKSKEYISSDSDDSDDSNRSIDVVNMGSPDKSSQGIATLSTNSKSSSSFNASSRTSTPSHTKSTKTTPGKSKSKEGKSSSKKNADKSKADVSNGFKDVFSEIGKPTDISPPEPLLSPIQSMPTLSQAEPFKPVPVRGETMSKIQYVNGNPTLVVKLDLSLIEKVPSKEKVKKEQEETRLTNVTSATFNASDDKPPKLMKIPKRKIDMKEKKEEKTEPAPIECKKIKKEQNEFVHKSPKQEKTEKPEPEHKEIGVKQEDNHEWDRKHPRRLSERRTSNSSIQSTSSRKNDKDSPPRKKVKKEHNSDLKHDNSKRKMKDWDAPSDCNDRTFLSETSTNHSNGHKAGNDWGSLASSVQLECPDRRHLDRRPPPPRIKMDFEDRQYPPNHYLVEAKDLKHQADAMTDKTAKALMYVDAVLSFIQCGNAIESDSETKSSPFTMYSQTSDLIKYILKFKGHGPDSGGVDKKLTVLCMRCQSLLYMRLFKLKKDHAQKFSKILSEHFKTPSKLTNTQAPSPYHANWNTKYTGTPSPMSPTPSPAGSIGSCGSLGSNNGDHYLTTPGSSQGKLPNGLATPSASPATVSIPHRIQSIMYEHITITNYLLYAHDLWEQADVLQQESQDFFRGLDCEVSQLTFHSSILDLVKYVRHGLHRLKSSASFS